PPNDPNTADAFPWNRPRQNSSSPGTASPSDSTTASGVGTPCCSAYTSREARRSVGEPAATARNVRVAANRNRPARIPTGIAAGSGTFGDSETRFEMSAAAPHAASAGTEPVQIVRAPTERSLHG